jgi:hypothetical protein
MKRSVCPSAASFRRLVNMTPAQIRAWSKDPRSRCYSKASTRSRLAALAKLRATPPARWTAKDCAFAARVVSFNARMKGALERDGCTPGYAVSLRNWGHAPRCAVPTSCKASKVAKGLGNAQAKKAARRRADRARRLRSVDEVQELVQTERELPAHIELYADYLRERGPKTPSLRDVVKAYTITRSSIQRGAATKEGVCRYFPELADLAPDRGADMVRPEDAFAHLLRTSWGKRYLDAAERGRFDRDAAWQLTQRMGCWGLTDTLMGDLRYAATRLPARYGSLLEAYRAGDDTWVRFVQDDVYNVSAAKAGFFRSLLGRGDVPTFDAREIDLWMRARREPGAEDVLELKRRMATWPMALPADLEPHRPHLVHHAIWDAAGGTATTHAEPVAAMQLAGARRRGRR